MADPAGVEPAHPRYKRFVCFCQSGYAPNAFCESTERRLGSYGDVSVVVPLDHVGSELADRYTQVISQGFPYIVVARKRPEIQITARYVTTSTLEANVQHASISSSSHFFLLK